MKTKNIKRGISLVVLVIIIVVMIILAAAVVITLNNTGVIEKANTAVDKMDYNEVVHIVNLAWSDAYMNGKSTYNELKEAVEASLELNNVDVDKYEIKIATTGVDVKPIDDAG